MTCDLLSPEWSRAQDHSTFCAASPQLLSLVHSEPEDLQTWQTAYSAAFVGVLQMYIKLSQ